MLNKSRFSVVLIALIVSSLVLFGGQHFSSAQSGTPLVTFQLYDTNGNPISQAIFQSVAPGTSSTLTVTMRSNDSATVYPSWNATNLPSGDTISGYWNGPEVWNINTGRMWNTWDTVTLQWTLSVPQNNGYATNVIVNIIINGSPTTSPMPTPSPIPTSSPVSVSTPYAAITPTLAPTATPIPTLLPTITPTPTATPTKPLFTRSTIQFMENAISLAGIITALAVAIIIGIKYLPKNNLRFVGCGAMVVGILAFALGNSINYFGFWTIPLIILMLIMLNTTALRRKHTITMIVCEITVIVELIIVWQVAQRFLYYSETNNWGTAHGYYVNELLWTVIPFAITIAGSLVMLRARKEFKD